MIINGDSLIELPKLEESSVDAIVTDPPYELGFMNRSWDATGIAYNVQLWKECLRVLKPGGHLLAFGGTRTYHRMAVAIEDAGFEIRDMIEWAYASGFPKSLNIGKAYDKVKGLDRKVFPNPKIKQQTASKNGVYGDYEATETVTVGTSIWEGFGTALKPAHEPICLARKPLSEKTIVENVLKHGTGAIDVDGCRVPYQSEDDKENANTVSGAGGQHGAYSPIGAQNSPAHNQGRFPANLIVSDDCLNDGNEMKTGSVHDCIANSEGGYSGGFGDKRKGDWSGDAGSFSRYFSLDSWFDQKKSEFPDSVQKTFPFLIVPKAAKSEKGGSTHPTMKPIDLMMYLVTLISKEGDTVLDPFAGSGTTLLAAQILGRKYIGIEKEAEYVEIIKARLEALPPTLF